MTYIIGDQTFIKHLDAWCFKSDQKSAKWINNNKTGIPPLFRQYDKLLYRGMTVNQEFLDKAANGKLSLDKFTSWTKDKNMAIKFAKEANKAGNKSSGNISILISKKVSSADQVIDIEKFVTFMGNDQLLMLGFDEITLDSANKEQEVMCADKLKISIKEIKVL